MPYEIADLRISLPEELIPPRFAEALRPFAVRHPDVRNCRRPELTLKPADPGIPRGHGWQELHRFEFADAGADCRFGRDEAGFLLEMDPQSVTQSVPQSLLRSGAAASDMPRCVRFRDGGPAGEALCDFTPEMHPGLFRFGLWTLFNLAALRHDAVALHASVICCRGRSILFLGESGTGKSTHTRLWREHIPGATLLNDDSPIIRLTDDRILAYGSPWSGKLPCYRPTACPVGAVVRLTQGPENRIRPLRPLEALGALIPSAPPAFIRDTELREAVCRLLGRIVETTPVCHLACRPDAEAARLVFRSLFGRTPPENRPLPTDSPARHTPQP